MADCTDESKRVFVGGDFAANFTARFALAVHAGAEKVICAPADAGM